MKKLRRLLIGLTAPSALILGLTHLGGTPIYKGYNTGFSHRLIASAPQKLEITTDGGDMTCWIRLKLPFSSQLFSANLSNGTRLHVYPEGLEGTYQWIAIVGEGQKPQEKFNWPSGATLFLVGAAGESIMPSDWRIYLTDQAFDSRFRARWRNILFAVTAVLFILSLVGVTFEAFAKSGTETSTSFTHERCLSELIMSTEGQSPAHTKWMQSVLQKVLLQRIPVEDALAPIPLNAIEKLELWFKTRDQFRSRLAELIIDLNVDLNHLPYDFRPEVEGTPGPS